MKKSPTKPTGVIGPISVSAEGLQFLRVEFPRTKDEIEEYIVNSFLKNSAALPLKINGQVQNQQNDFDFTIDTSEGKKYLELMEIAPLENLRGSYDRAPSSYKPYEFAAYIFQKMMGKSAKYQGAASSKICLLIYITDWSFTLSETVIALLQYWAVQTEHSFENVFCYSPIDQHNGVTKLIFPTPKEYWSKFDPSAYLENEVINFSPLKWEIQKIGLEGGT
jgi:hypothetical protein